MTINRERVELWAQALESDGYKQCTGQLRCTPKHSDQPMHCAEGVAMAVAEMHGVRIYPVDWRMSNMPPRVYQWYGITGNVTVDHEEQGRMTVIAANDNGRMSFWDIAQLLRAKYVKGEER